MLYVVCIYDIIKKKKTWVALPNKHTVYSYKLGTPKKQLVVDLSLALLLGRGIQV